MKKSALLETSKWRDIVELGLCMEIYDVCNDNQFDFCTPLDFANFMNLRELPEKISVKNKEKRRVCYMIQAVANKINPKKEADKWVSLFLEKCGIEEAYFKSHSSYVKAKDASKENKEFKNSIDNAINNWFLKDINHT